MCWRVKGGPGDRRRRRARSRPGRARALGDPGPTSSCGTASSAGSTPRWPKRPWSPWWRRPGYGKTTVLSQWAAGAATAPAWVAVRATDDEPSRLLARVAEALLRVSPDDDVLASVAAGGPTPWEVRLQRLLVWMSAEAEGRVVVIDDVHRLHDPRALGVLGALTSHPSRGWRLAVASRSRAGLAPGSPAGAPRLRRARDGRAGVRRPGDRVAARARRGRAVRPGAAVAAAADGGLARRAPPACAVAAGAARRSAGGAGGRRQAPGRLLP